MIDEYIAHSKLDINYTNISLDMNKYIYHLLYLSVATLTSQLLKEI